MRPAAAGRAAQGAAARLDEGTEEPSTRPLRIRLADAARLEKLYFLDWPEHLSEKKLKRVSRSTVQYVPYERIDLQVVRQLAAERPLVGLELGLDAQPPD